MPLLLSRILRFGESVKWRLSRRAACALTSNRLEDHLSMALLENLAIQCGDKPVD